MNVKKIIKDRAEHYEMQDETLFLADALNDAVECMEIVDRLEKLIPQNTPYCYTPIGWNEDGGFFETKPCPYWVMATVNDPQYGECRVEWCHYLGKELDVQDQVKECGISEGL